MTEAEESGKKELTHKDWTKPPEWLKDKDFPPINPEVAQALETEELQPVKVDRALIKVLIRRVKCMRMLKFLYDKNDAFFPAQVGRAIGITQYTCQMNLDTLADVGIVKKRKIAEIDTKVTYYWLPEYNRKSAELVLKSYYWHVGHILARLVPYEANKISTDKLQEDARFKERCKKYGVSEDEGIEFVKKCPKTDVEERYNGVFIWRNEQGYEPPEPEKKVKSELEPKAEEVEFLIEEG